MIDAGYRFFLAWGSNGNEPALELQQEILHDILLNEKDGKEFLFLGDRLQKDMKDAAKNNPFDSLACFDAVRFGMDPEILVTDLHPFYVYEEEEYFNL